MLTAGRGSAAFGVLILLVLACVTGCASAVRPPILNSAAPVDYPDEARAQQIEGSVTLRYEVDRSGRVHNVSVVSAEPPGMFEAAAIKSLSAWRFTPARRNGENVASSNQVSTLTFKLGEKDEYHRD